ncbi:chloride channel protein [Pedobacter sp. JY14-1]|uniref:chloride channel protein n=1 Tax=Pedobacter sp. JY14-1 TaxID=3034151 RepID=UPI0023E231AD|nr:chloride channel protein [Pedobacter sp. JY14-1]
MNTRFPKLFLAAGKWLLLSALVGAMAGSLSALFLWMLEQVTAIRTEYGWLVWLLPVAGFWVGLAYHYLGKDVARGNHLVFDTIHNPRDLIRFRMAPMVLMGTVITHLFGGSAGREGTALQMSAAAADQLHRPFRLSGTERSVLLIAGLSAGFASVFGTPLAGFVFGLEVLLLGRVPYGAVIPALAAAFTGTWVTELWGIGHTHYEIGVVPGITLMGLIYSLLAGVAFAIAAILFVRLTELFVRWFAKITFPPLRPFAGGIVVLLLVTVLGTNRYLGLGVPVIVESFSHALDGQEFALKLLFTAVTLGAGFKGGEVTPLFFIGAALGSSLSLILPLPVGLMAGMGFVAVFAGAAKTPVACCLMALELFGLSCAVYVIVACFTAYMVSGRYSIYNAPENKFPKHFLL